MCVCVCFLTCAVVGLVAGVCDFGPQLQVVSGLVVGRAVGTQGKHAPCEARQVTHLPLQVPVLPLADEGETAVRLTDKVPLDRLEREREIEGERRKGGGRR